MSWMAELTDSWAQRIEYWECWNALKFESNEITACNAVSF